ncbi:imidazolonepropionase-like amidohydrolase [Kutzneria viridogrisea]|uniref:Imidazolonepropionase-like amidohydrolase n=1 Tax=Kutzneria viridogrisea TaxID=47990 RepID=A0ABR6BLT3_9PSEU|nr:imidazolonepropionase-like amidohydrolase [Kutzneria viridogrisea]
MGRTVLHNVRVFDGTGLRSPGTVVIEAGLIGSGDATGARVLDGAGGVLLPGLIDAHLHLAGGRQDLVRLREFGVTTALDMACAPPEFVRSLRGLPGLPAVRSAGTPAIAPGSPHSHIPLVGQLGILRGAQEAARFVAERVAEGSDYLKIVINTPAPSHEQATLNALVAAAHAHGRPTVAHVTSCAAVEEALLAGVDILTHVPLDRALTEDLTARVLAGGQFVVPTLSMMEGVIAQSAPPGASYEAARASVRRLHRAGVPVIAGTDANASPGVPAAISHGDSLHRELELLVDAGLSTVDALRSATSLPAKHFGLTDRGVIEPGRRADLVLVEGDPLSDITATRSIRAVWCGGVEHIPG